MTTINIPKHVVQSVLVTVLLLLTIVRLLLLWCFQSKLSWYKIGLGVCDALGICSAVPSGFFWSENFLTAGEILFSVNSILPTLQVVSITPFC